MLINGQQLEFPNPIKEAIAIGAVLVVLTYRSPDKTNENVWGVNAQGRILWQVPQVNEVEFEVQAYAGIEQPYTGIHRVDDHTVRLFNWDGGAYDLDVRTGRFTKNIIAFRKGKRPW